MGAEGESGSDSANLSGKRTVKMQCRTGNLYVGFRVFLLLHLQGSGIFSEPFSILEITKYAKF